MAHCASPARPIRAWAVPAHKGLGHTSSSRTRSPSFLFPPPPPPSPPRRRPPLPPPIPLPRCRRGLRPGHSLCHRHRRRRPPLPPFDAYHLESLAELLLAVTNRPNHGLDCLSRALACESLRELEHAHSLLLSYVIGHLWALTQAERTHAAQSYLLLLAAVIRNIALHGLLSFPSSILSTSTPLVPFSTPQSLFSSSHPNREPSDLNLREMLHPPHSGPCQARLKMKTVQPKMGCGPCRMANFFSDRAMHGLNFFRPGGPGPCRAVPGTDQCPMM